MKDILTQRLKRHDEAAFEEVMNKYLPLVSNIVYNIGRDRLSKEDMEETISDIFVILWNNTDKIIEGKLQGYLCRIARTKALDPRKSSFLKRKNVHFGLLKIKFFNGKINRQAFNH